MKLKTRLYVTVLAVVTFPGVRELLVWLADRIFNTTWAPFYRLWINIAGGFVVAAVVVETLWEVWDMIFDSNFVRDEEHFKRRIKYTFKKD